MSSVVFYKFKSQKEPSRIAFDGTGISVWELKKEIIMEAKLGKGSDFDFSIYNENDEEYMDDHAVIPRSTSVLARRLPPSKAGRGNAQNYMAAVEGSNTGFGRNDSRGGYGANGAGGGAGWKAGSMSKRFDGKDDYRNGGGAGGRDDMQNAPQEPAPIVLPAAANGDEASALAAMFAATSQQWQQTQEQMASQTPIHRAPMRPARPAAPAHVNGASPVPGLGSPAVAGAVAPPEQSAYQHASTSHKPPPVGYICYRCGQKGHWIQDCPTNNDRAWDDKPRIKRTTGIPKSFLTVVEGPGGEDTPTGVMVTPDGGFVIARPDNASWLAHRSLTKNLSPTDIQNLAPTDPDLTCPICSRLLRDSTLTPCCSTAFCENCLHNALGDNDMLCPECESKIKNLEKLTVDKGRRERVKVYIEEMVESSREIVEETAEVPAEVVEAEVVIAETEASPVVDGATNAGEAVIPSGEAVKSTIAEVEPAAVPSEVASIASPAPNGSSALEGVTREIESPLPSAPNETPPPQLSVPMSLTPQQQQQYMRQQQLQQQRALVMQQNPMMGMGISPPMLQQQMYQLNMTLSNPHLHPQMRMNLQMQLQQCQMMAMQMGLMPGNRNMGNSIAQAYGGNFANGRGGMPQYQQNMGMRQNGMGMGGGQSIPLGPRAAPPAVDPRNAKRQLEEDIQSGGNQKKRAVSPEIPSGAPPA